MRRKRYKNIPENAFIPRPARIGAILQLCLAFTLFCWVASWPFMGEMLAHKKRIFLFQTVMGSGELISRTYAEQPEILDQLKQNRAHFLALDPEVRTPFIDAYNREQAQESARTFTSKCKDSLVCLFFSSSPWFRAWLLLSVVAALLLLKKSPGAPYAAWILPLIALAWCIESAQHPKPPTHEERLFPTEEYLVSTYGRGTSSQNLFAQQDSLKRAWKEYVVAEWSTNGNFQEGDWRFQLERLRRVLQDPTDSGAPSPNLLLLFVLWNGAIAWVGYRWRDPALLRAYA